MVKLSRAIAAVLLCSGLLFSAGLVRATQEKPSPEAQKAQKNDKAKSAPEQQKPAPDQQKAPEETTVTMSGKVTKITDSNVTIVDDQKAEHTVVLTADTKITKGGKDAAVSDVKADDLVTILAKKGDGDALTAVQIAIS